uniref:Uncharacterized protein n=1 Tax=Sphaerodactylus townsendi TaxID=933632 RepID=A0ACB8FHB4_9SAUR
MLPLHWEQPGQAGTWDLLWDHWAPVDLALPGCMPTRHLSVNTHRREGQAVRNALPGYLSFRAMSAPRRGVYWQAEEVTILLRMVRDCGHAWLLMASTGLPNRRAFRAVARALQVAGFHRTEVQACTKWKALKRDFFAAMERSGGHPRRSDWSPHFAAMRQLWRLAGEPRRWTDAA